MNLLPRLPEAGFAPSVFALELSRNIESPVPLYTAPAPLGPDTVLIEDRPLQIAEKVRAATKVVYDPALRKNARRVLRDSGAELLYGLQIAHYLYPEMVLAAADLDLPVVLRLSDFQFACPAYSMYRDGAPCEDCRHGLYHGIAHGCLKGSRAMSAVRVAAMWMHRLMRVTDFVHAFVCPTRFMAQKMIDFGYPTRKMVVLPTPIPPELGRVDPSPPDPDGPVLYVGGLYEPKGAQLLVEASITGKFPLVIAGDTKTPLGRSLIEQADKAGADHIAFPGFVSGDDLALLYRKASCVVVPSIWYENSPNTALEAMAYGRPVIASESGSMPELVRDGETGLLFSGGNVNDLADKINELRSNGRRLVEMGEAARKQVIVDHAMANHVEALGTLFTELLP